MRNNAKVTCKVCGRRVFAAGKLPRVHVDKNTKKLCEGCPDDVRLVKARFTVAVFTPTTLIHRQ